MSGIFFLKFKSIGEIFLKFKIFALMYKKFWIVKDKSHPFRRI